MVQEREAEPADDPGSEPESQPESQPESPDAPRYTDTNLPKAGDVIAERYRIDHELGRGGMAVVYAATQLPSSQLSIDHQLDGRRVALKWMFEGRSHRDERRRRFLREARAAGSIQHPNVVRVYDAGEHDSGVFLVMELVEGESLAAVLARGTMTASSATDLLMPALRGVHAAHRKGVVHRDLKPDNLYVCKPSDKVSAAREVKVLDFGLSKLVGPAVDSLLTLPGMLVGTPQYMAPEQADHRIGNVDERSDIYTLAVILYEAVAGRRPFESESFAGLLMKVAHDDPTPLDEIVGELPDEFAAVVMWGLARDPLLRPANVEDFAVALEPFGSVPFATEGHAPATRVSELRESMRVPAARAPGASERAPGASVRAPGAQASAQAAVPAQPSSPSSSKLWIAALLLLFSVAALWVFGDDRTRESDKTPLDHAPQPASPAQPSPTQPKLDTPQASTPTMPVAPTPSAPEAATPSEQVIEPSPVGKRPRASQAGTSSTATRSAPAAAPQALPAAPEGPNRKVPSKPIGVADPWE